MSRVIYFEKYQIYPVILSLFHIGSLPEGGQQQELISCQVGASGRTTTQSDYLIYWNIFSVSDIFLKIKYFFLESCK